MEVKINKEIMDYTETMFFGLSMRQFFFSALACGIAVLLYFRLEPLLGLETTSWVCIVAAFPFAVIGFLKYTFLTPKKLVIGNDNYYYDMLSDLTPERNTGKNFHRRGSRQKRKHSPKSAGNRQAAKGRDERAGVRKKGGDHN